MKHPIRNGLLGLILLSALSLSALGAAGIYERAVPAASMLQGEGLYCGLIAQGLASGTILTVCDRSGTTVCTAALPGNGQMILGPLDGGADYELKADGRSQGRFRLEENASIRVLSGALRSDGELLYTDTPVDRVLQMPSLP